MAKDSLQPFIRLHVFACNTEMKVLLLLIAVGQFACSSACSQQKAVSASNSERPIAFPGAEGFGKYSTGGRGGKVFVITNLNDAGPGSFREAVTAKEKRIVVFAVSGTIHLNSRLNIASNVTIAGQSAPGDGICIADHPVILNGDNIIIRYLRFRMGDRYQNKGKVDGGGSDDALSGVRKNNILIDHCSVSWSTDEVMSVYAGDSSTIQWTIISEPLNYSYHFETGDTDFEHHGFGGIWGGKHLTAHHNLFAHCNNRTPRFDGIRNSPQENVDYRNNVVFNWGNNNIYAGEGGNYNIINNYFKSGPSTKEAVKYRIANPYSRVPDINFGKWFVQGNFVDGSPTVTSDNWQGVKMEKGTSVDVASSKLQNAIDIVTVETQSAQLAYELVLKNAGAVLPTRDTLDERIINDVINRTGRLIDVQGGYPHGTHYEKTVNAWPVLKSKAGFADADQDGMPDHWETKQKLNPRDGSDASSFSLSKSYSNIEIYLNGITGD